MTGKPARMFQHIRNKVAGKLNEVRGHLHVSVHGRAQRRYATAAERYISPHVASVALWSKVTWAVFLGSAIAEFFFEYMDDINAMARAGGLLVGAALIFEIKITHVRTKINVIRNGNLSPRGDLSSAHTYGPFADEWLTEQVNNTPVPLWLMAKENQLSLFERRLFWMALIGTLVWAYGDIAV